MKTKFFSLAILAGLCALALLPACDRVFLDAKPSSSLIVPKTLADFQRLLDNHQEINAFPILGEMASDDYYLNSDGVWGSLPVHLRNAYIWKTDLYEGTENIQDWNVLYKQIFIANVVLDGLSGIVPTERDFEQWNSIKGWALFVRASAFYNLAQLFAPVFDEQTADEQRGIPIRLSAGVERVLGTSSVRVTYRQILEDLSMASELLPADLPHVYRNRPSKPASFALTSRILLNMANYEGALAAADRCLELYATLVDYNSVDRTSFIPFSRNNDETLYQATLGLRYPVFDALIFPNTVVDPRLYASYRKGDLRKTIFFYESGGLPKRKASYTGAIQAFGGLAVDEVYLVKSEALVRLGRVQEGLVVLNDLLMHRMEDGVSPNYDDLSQDEALAIVLKERRKELVFRGIRWQDLKRFSRDGINDVKNRAIAGTVYSLAPDDEFYTMPIPPDEKRLNPGM